MTNSSHIGAQLRVVGVGDSQLGTRTSHRIAPQEAESGQELEAGAVAGRSDGDGLLELLPRRQLPAADHVLTGWSICSYSWVALTEFRNVPPSC